MQLFEISIRKKDNCNYCQCQTEAVCENIFDEYQSHGLLLCQAAIYFYSN
jgi:hypothetical protein